jgi:hypothetical protein
VLGDQDYTQEWRLACRSLHRRKQRQRTWSDVQVSNCVFILFLFLFLKVSLPAYSIVDVGFISVPSYPVHMLRLQL